MAQKIIFDKENNKKERLWFIRYWADYVRTHNDREWSKQQANFINAQFHNSNEFYKKLIKQKNGKQKIIEIFNIKNKKGFPSLFKQKK